MQHLYYNTMSIQTQEARIILAIEAIRTTKKLSIRAAAKIYDVPRMTLVDRMKGRVAKPKKRNAQHNLTLTKEETLIQYILDLDSQGFPPWIDDVRDMANLLYKTRHAKLVGKQWPYNFVQRCPELKTRFSCVYDF